MNLSLRKSQLLLSCYLLLNILLLANAFEAYSNHDVQGFSLVQFQIYSTSDTIELYDIKLPTDASVKFWLLTNELYDTEKSQIIYRILNARDEKRTYDMAYSNRRDRTIKFIDLDNSQTYFLYYVVSFGIKSYQAGPFIEVIRTNRAIFSLGYILVNYITSMASFLLPIISIIVSIFVVGMIESKWAKPFTKPIDIREEMGIKPMNSARKGLRLRDQIEFTQDSIASWKSAVTQHNTSMSITHDKSEVERTIRKLEDENKEFEDRLLCEICCERFREVIFLGCGHIYCCEKCAMGLIICPIDKSTISSKFRYNMADKFGISHQFLPQIIASKLQRLDIVDPMMSLLDPVNNEGDVMDKYLLLKIRNDNYRMFYNCIICGERKKHILFMSCRHFICCQPCSQNIKMCPLDNTYISKRINVFTA